MAETFTGTFKTVFWVVLSLTIINIVIALVLWLTQKAKG